MKKLPQSTKPRRLGLMLDASGCLTGLTAPQYTKPRRFAVMAMVAASLSLFVASLFLPVAYGAEIFGIMRGWVVFLLAVLSPFSFSHSPLAILWILWALSYLSTPVSLLTAKRSYWLAAGQAAFGLVFPAWLLVSNGLYIEGHHRKDELLNSGGLCALAAAALMLGAWAWAGKLWRNRVRQPEDDATTD
ncbi:MAG: hypothetical protein AAB466_02610 [Verrucomicrobiota bacterium]